MTVKTAKIDETTETAAPAAAKEKAVPKPKREIIRGRMVPAIVYLVRFGDGKAQLAESTNAKAELFGTTVGKVYDIEKNRNFAYVTEDSKFSQEMIDEGITWIEHHPYFEKDGAQKVVDALKKMKPGNAEEVQAFLDRKTAARGQNATTKSGEKADAGGGNRVGKSEKAEDKSAKNAASADELLG